LLESAAALGLLTFGAVCLRHRRQPIALGEHDVLNTNFANAADDPMFDCTPQQALTIQLEQWPYPNHVPVERIQQALQLIEQPTDARQTQKLAGEAFQRTGGTALLEGRLPRSAVSVLSTSQRIVATVIQGLPVG
jgi:hypothetical protein